MVGAACSRDGYRNFGCLKKYNRKNSRILVILNFSSFILECLYKWKNQVAIFRVI
jgi:hypothetical protein